MCQKHLVRDRWRVFEHTEFRSSEVRGILMFKKGNLARTKLAGFILAIFMAVVFLAFTGNVSMTASDVSVEEQCRASVIRNARYHIAGLDLGSEIDCPTRKLELKKEYSEKEAKEKLARAMYGCWRQFGQGRLNLFSGEGVFCNVCYIVGVNTEEPLINFTEYLMTTPSPTENMYYYDYLSSFETSKAGEIVGDIELSQLRLEGDEVSNEEGENKYAILFVYAKGQDNFEKISRQLFMKSPAGKAVTPIAFGSGVAAGVGTAVAITTVAGLFTTGTGVVVTLGSVSTVVVLTAPVAVPVIIVAGTAVAVGAGVFIATEWVGTLFNPDSPPEWAAFNLLREWNPDETPEILKDELGCQVFV